MDRWQPHCVSHLSLLHHVARDMLEARWQQLVSTLASSTDLVDIFHVLEHAEF